MGRWLLRIFRVTMVWMARVGNMLVVAMTCGRSALLAGCAYFVLALRRAGFAVGAFRSTRRHWVLLMLREWARTPFFFLRILARNLISGIDCCCTFDMQAGWRA